MHADTLSDLAVVLVVAAAAMALTRGQLDIAIRQAELTLVRLLGGLYRSALSGWGLGLLLLADAILVLEAFERLLGLPLAELLQPLNIAAVTILLRAFLEIVISRSRLIVQDFTDFTPDGKAPKGLATLLVVELARLGRLYARVDDRGPLRAATSSDAITARPVDVTLKLEDIGET